MELTLQFVNENNEVEEKEFKTPFVNSSVMLEYLDFEETIENPQKLKTSEIKKYAELVATGFNNQFTIEEFLAGIPSYQLMGVIREFITFINTNPYRTGSGDGGSGKPQKTAR